MTKIRSSEILVAKNRQIWGEGEIGKILHGGWQIFLK